MKNKSLLLVLAANVFVLAACNPAATSSASSTVSESSRSSDSTSASSQSASSQSATSSTPVSSSSSSSEPASSSSEPSQLINIAYFDDTFAFSTEKDATAGSLVYWAGDGGTVTKATKSDGKYSLSYSSSGQWYGVQLFYKLPYAETGDSYAGSFTLTSDVAGSITVNSKIVTLIAGDNAIAFTSGAGTALSIQLGTANPSAKLAGAALSLSVPEIYDKTAGAVYNEVRFVNDGVTVKDIEVKKGKTVIAPADPTKQGYLFDGWYNGETAYQAGTAINSPVTYTAKWIDESQVTQYTVTFQYQDQILGTTKVVSGKTIVVPTDLVLPFGYAVKDWYKDSALTSLWTLASMSVTGDLTLYAKLAIHPTSTYMATGDTGYVIPAVNLTNDEAGNLKVSGFNGWGSADSWAVQVNFAPVPQGTASAHYAINFKYKINGDGADVKLCDVGNGYALIGSAVNLATAADWTAVSLPFSGASFSANTEVTFELGKIATSVAIDFEISAFALVSIN